jgi:DNA helicase-2/ATP-dependent DNA helicase PcrA
VEHVDGPLLVLAGAGSGKTRVLTVRIAHLVDEHGVPPESILALTFTNKAAGEMRDRIARLLEERPHGLWSGTFHSFGAWLLRRHAERVGWSSRFTIHDAEESLTQVERVMEALDLDRERWKPRGLRNEIAAAKHYLVTPEAYEAMLGPDPEPFEEVCRQVYERYRAELKRQDAFDFEDLLMKAVELLREHPEVRRRYRERFSFILVDEYQDTNHAQYRLVQLLGQEHRNVMVVGDDDQSIYGWRGADLRNILEFESDFGGCRTVRLEKNYRSTGHILAAANAVIRHNEERKEKSLFTERGSGEPVTVARAPDETAEANWIVDRIEERSRGDGGTPFRDIALLYRTNAQSRALEDAVRRRGIPYQIVGGVRFYERREIRDVLAYLRLFANPRDRASFERAVNWPRRGIGEVTRSRLFEIAREEGRTALDVAREADRYERIPARGARSLRDFADLVERYREEMERTPAAELLRRLITEIDLLQVLKEEGPEGEERAENVEELVAAAAEMEERTDPGVPVPEVPDDLTSLDRFLQEVALVADADHHDPDADAVSLMTLHNSKGLEFSDVFITGLEEGLFPHSRSYGTQEDMEEERRLFYVGLTRARDRATVTHAETRRRFGSRSYASPSRFLDELPEEHVKEVRIGAGDGDHEPWRDLEAGDEVEHPRFGAGVVARVKGEPDDPRAVVDFDDGRTKTLLARYAELRISG